MTIERRNRAGRHWSWCRLPTIATLCLFVCGCGGTDGTARGAGKTPETTPSAAGSSQGDSLRVLVRELASLQGWFSQTGIGFAWEFEGPTDLFHSIADYGDSAVVRLVFCLSDTTEAAATAEGRRVLVGAVCYEALRRVAYFEWDPSEYTDAPRRRWPGVVDPTANPEELRAAQQAWAQIVREHRYILN